MTDHSDIKTALLGLIAAAAFIAAAIISVTPAHSAVVHRISAVGVSDIVGSAKFNEWRARRIAIRNWQSKAAARFGAPSARWLSARSPEVQCDGRARFVRCEASGIPALRR
jgi:Zn-dependent alcohol dehydrogenase